MYVCMYIQKIKMCRQVRRIHEYKNTFMPLKYVYDKNSIHFQDS